MELVWGSVVVVLASIAWLGQVVAWVAPATAVRLSLMEAEVDVEPAYWADIRGEATWDSLSLWTLPLAGLLLLLSEPWWAVFGLIGGGAFLYFAGRGIVTRRAMQQRGMRIGASGNVRIGFVFLGIWGLVALVTVVSAAASLGLGSPPWR
jgi:hypothetical protein